MLYFCPPSRQDRHRDRLLERIAAVDVFEHRVDLGDGIETPGHFRMADYLPHYRLPPRLDGLRVLDVGTGSGFFAFEFERRGAAHVAAVDLIDGGPRIDRGDPAPDTSAPDAFTVVGEALGSTRVRRVFLSLDELGAEHLGTFDLVFCGAMSLHVADPILAIDRLRNCCRPGARLVAAVTTHEAGAPHRQRTDARQRGPEPRWRLSATATKKLLTCSGFAHIGNEVHFALECATRPMRLPTFVCHAIAGDCS